MIHVEIWNCGFLNSVYETIDHIPSSCIVATVQVVKDHQYSAYTVLHASASIAEKDSETSIMTSFDASINHRDELDSGVQLLDAVCVSWNNNFE
jgi:hypothetical protein